MTHIDIDEVSFVYKTGSQTALRDVSVSIEAGELFGVTGPTESGKTTFCRLLPSFVPNFFEGRFEGSVTVAGTDAPAAGIGALGETVGYVFENPFDQLTGSATSVLEEVAFGLEQRNVPHADLEDRARSALATVGAAALADRSPRSLSGGQLQRVAIASVLAFEPEILVLDEPTSQLDPEGTDSVFEVITELQADGYTVVLVSQDLQALAPRADRLAVFQDGNIRRCGPPREVLEDFTLDSRIRVPPTVQIGRALRDQGTVPAGRPLPLTVAETAGEITQYATSVTPMTGDGGHTASPRTEDPRVVIEDLEYDYDDGPTALDGVSLQLDAGCVAILGHNGAGKTTLAKHLNGLLTPTAGTVRIRGTDTTEAPVHTLAHDVGLVFQDPEDQLFRTTVAEEVRFGPENLGSDDGAARVETALEQVGLSDCQATPTHELGRARRKRVALASVLAMDTPIVVLDEPTGEQDAAGTEIVGEVVESLVAAGRLVVCITHDVDFASRHADRIIALADGSVVADGPPRAVFTEQSVMAETGLQAPVPARVGQAVGLDEVISVQDLVDRIE